ncbi:Snf7-domain-containing protein [Exophiala viscosa]|uniref:Snf7-domain-containing protein n=1 Tax=Exophiala viscosa TaxID=2486360 RepID=UPI0021A09F47|nr:Snf7-domain-containing protein [Exophiala viscosa]
MSPLLEWLVENEPSFRKTRLPSLYSDLTVQKSTNPEGYAANVTAWASALTRASLAGQLPLEQRLILQASDDLLNALASAQYGRPSGLGSVLDDCVRQGKMVDLHDFLASEKSIYTRSWIPSPWAVLRWSLRQVGIVGTGSYEVNGHLKKGSLVLVPALEEVWKHVQRLRDRSAQGLTDRIMSRETFLKELNDLIRGTLSDQDVTVLLRYLSRDKHALSYDDATIKFKAPASTTPEPITHEDRSIANLKSLISNLTLQIANLNTRIATLQSTAQTLVKNGNKASALSALRSKKLAEQSLASRTGTLHQLEQVYAKLEAAADQVEIVAAMQASAGALKTLNHKVGGVERVEDVLDTLREEMGKTDEVSGVIAEPLDNTAVLDEGEVDEELESMEREERSKREALERAEKERRDAQEAEATRRRLADLEGIETEARSKEQAADPVEQGLSRSIEKMQKLHLDGRQQPQVAEGAS